MQPAPPPIPYVEHHAGGRRLLTVRLEVGATRAVAPVVAVDGRAYVVTWPVAVFEIPADRPVHVSVHLMGMLSPCPASVLLFPASQPELTYRVPDVLGPATLS
ncbi:hypothetical protein GC722_04490 [Auraticoccus sp. F435]|uniref:Uncharacterized protein n=1 Tax=Auraticoccus cholistanensis TaxID=2656650 RepID=A0A6A9V0E7_9ACTN|nr:hypothetical protein [Auraticoccus cholistanensis]MVA75290.1 hypothetical protein [Auraticoccus cholistanensis]